MAKPLGLGGLLTRLLFALVLVLGTYNPTDYSYVSWLLDEATEFGPVTSLVGVLLLTGWVVLLRATFMSLGMLGIVLGVAVFGCLAWLFVDIGWLSLDSGHAVTWLILVITALVLALGMSWSHIRRRLTGQVDVDELDD